MPFSRVARANLNVISHEVRTPLNGIMGLVSMLQDQELPEQTRSIINRLAISAETLTQVLNSGIEVERIGQHRVILAERDYSLLEVAENSVRRYAAEAEARGVELSLQFDPRLIAKTFVGDAERIGQILSALVSNAVKFTDTGSATLIIALRKEKITATQITVKMIDTGIGIREEDLEAIFGAYYQVESAQRGRPSGTGCGLYIAANLLQLMNSKLSARSSELGTEFEFLVDLPVSEAQPPIWVATAPQRRVRIFAPASAQIELMCDLLRSLDVNVDRFSHVESDETQMQADLRLIDYRIAASNLPLFRELVSCLPRDALCVLTTEFEPATALLAKGAKQWSTPYLTSELLKHAAAAGVIKKRADHENSVNPSEDVVDLTRYTVLCVDDSPTNLIVLMGALTKLGFNRVLRATDGQEAVEVMRDHPEVDLILMDFHMPRLDGAQAAQQIRSGGSTAAIIGVTALSEADLESQINDDSFDLVLTKPVTRAGLAQAIGRSLGIKIMEDQ